eukprot:CAMPEP_0177152526 /NCGR_PEP_ID=MMETSP0367-20130122/577_1 /TAXON_ID=447022 ORGANISM="Scrippsiella hangoei-like, Strain SHHI-4" /NCGR_SAMPLE_ID=MMETSP0367 /ASSEMBLY_ACC=CAM_ASM_000362 /LENGTH=57 /DNA_ID=CAMNT_0018597593 /DNA_START=204 /DNA_END=375 /DNA_ORIENTATION=+
MRPMAHPLHQGGFLGPSGFAVIAFVQSAPVALHIRAVQLGVGIATNGLLDEPTRSML